MMKRKYSLIQCLDCGIEVQSTGNRQQYCKPCIKVRRKKFKKETLERFWKTHPNYMAIAKWFSFTIDYLFNPLGHFGYCLACGDSDPLVLNNHHIFGRNNSKTTITLCANCHEYIRKGFASIVYQRIQNNIEG